MKRYAVTLDFYVHASNEHEAMSKSEKIAKEIRDKYDNSAKVIGISESSFGHLKLI
jgi:hypothetical protein